MAQMTHPAQTHAEIYESILVPAVYEIWAEMLVEIAKPRNGDRALDVACGTGVVARLLSQKVGAVLLVLGGMHFFNLLVFSRIRRRARLADAPPPVAPDGVPPPLTAGA